MESGRIYKQIKFLIEADKLKEIYRRTYLQDGSRRENSAEHSWHIALMAIILNEYTIEPVNINHVLMLLLIHDMVEIDAGDTYCYDMDAEQDRAWREKLAAERLFSILPDDQSLLIRKLWEEFEMGETPEAHFAIAMDRLMPLLLNYANKGKSWKENGISVNQVMARVRTLKASSPFLWEFAVGLIGDAVEKGFFSHNPNRRQSRRFF